ncbi:MAG: M24 family metallopeptidase [Polyangiaceae bacterium]|nr:M24 family metallopeptidase [Polyangiaceae bacterium]
MCMFAKRRETALDRMAARAKDAIALFPAAPTFIRNNDVEHEYRQDSDFHYLVGYDEPASVAILDGKSRELTMFVRPRDPEREVWDGPRAGVDGAKATFGAHHAFPIAELTEKLPKILANHRTLYYRLGRDRAFDEKLFDALDRTRAMARTGAYWPTEIVDPAVLVHEMRLRKGPDEVELMRKAAAITHQAHALAMGHARPGMHEYEIEAVLLNTFRKWGSERPAYGSIVGSGPNATVLHYRQNDRKMEDGDLLLIDAGCEYGYYASDVTRTFPVNGTFSKPQQAIYELVLEAQLAGIEACRPGSTLDAVHRRCVEVLTRGLVRLGILSGDPEKAIAEETFKPFYMHRTSHWLGMDVHDVGGYFEDSLPRPLSAGMVLTVEPGIYIAAGRTDVPAEYRGIGVRIEDDILVTATGHENLTGAIPKTVDELRAACVR